MANDSWFEGCTICDSGLCQRFDYYIDVKKCSQREAAKRCVDEAIPYVVGKYKIDGKTAANIVPTNKQLLDKYRYLKGLDKRERVSESPTKPKSVFNETNQNVEWARWTWNPVTGCKHGCPYCYARDIANRFYKEKFEPTFHKNRLSAPQNTPFPNEDRFNSNFTKEGNRTVFVCSMADLFGDWVPRQWIESVLEAVKKSPQWKYLFLTKNPTRYLEFEWPDYCWLGATADTQNRYNVANEVFRDLGSTTNCIYFISCEPLEEKIVPADPVFHWLIIGGRSKSSNMPANQPKWEWVESLLLAARHSNISVYFKPNLTVRPREYPNREI